MKDTQALFFLQMELGPMANFVYFMGDPSTREMMVVDPAWDVNTIRQVAADHDYRLTKALITHGHPDHINAVETLLHEDGIQVYMHKDEVPWIDGWKETAIATEHLTKVALGQHEISCIHTPGHTQGSQCFLFNDQLITGDTLFIDGCGRTDLPGGDPEKLYTSLTQVIRAMPDQTVLYPGHRYHEDAHQCLSDQKRTNPFLQAQTKTQFLSKVRPDLSHI
jgi:glyoxylase-like metal-dependent hydrolase (beta-lactamase superfamily II)